MQISGCVNHIVLFMTPSRYEQKKEEGINTGAPASLPGIYAVSGEGLITTAAEDTQQHQKEIDKVKIECQCTHNRPLTDGSFS